MIVPWPPTRARPSTLAFLGLGFLAFLAWPAGMIATAVLLLPAAAVLFPIRESGRIAERATWRLFASYCLVAFVGIAAVVAAWLTELFAAVLLFPFFAALLVFVRDAVPQAQP